MKSFIFVVLYIAIGISASLLLDTYLKANNLAGPAYSHYLYPPWRALPRRSPPPRDAPSAQGEAPRERAAHSPPRQGKKEYPPPRRTNWEVRKPVEPSQELKAKHFELLNGGLNLCVAYPQDQKLLWAPNRNYVTASVVVDNCSWSFAQNPREATLLWTIGQHDIPEGFEDKLRLGNGQIWNQIEDGWTLTDKTNLHYLLVKANKLHYQPETFILSDPTECVQFFKLVQDHPEYIWVTKVPTSSQGEGITINPPIDFIKAQWLDTSAPGIKCKGAHRSDSLIQRYIRNPLLLEGKKMEIRSYWVLASVDPLIIFYRDGTVRLTTRDYKEEDWNDPLIHITNTRQQKKADPNYYQTEAQRKWNLDQLAEYLKDQGKIQDGKAWLEKLRADLKERIAVSVLAAYPKLLSDMKMEGWDGRFELFGMDVILDSDLGMWLTELQDGPGLSLDPGVKRLLIPKLVKELTDIILEIDTLSRLGRKLSFPLESRGDWQQLDMTQYLSHLPPQLINKNWRLNVN
eukprot:TRINITY_DN126_c0_g1_i1.p1 TRINITY_DN126_c0_g1~~TRINITY_DN126_c0_g1_i1.p1  ORF type:complete len:515 (-),score=94.17 TRINITY_DN126_c0_g1_i1:15-1559(-)